MKGTLHVLARRDPQSPILASERVEYEDPPVYMRCFAVCTASRPGGWKTGQVEVEPRVLDDRRVWFASRHTSYIIERDPL